MMHQLANYRRVWLVDFEFSTPSGERPRPLCLVARELKTDRLERLWFKDPTPPTPPYDLGPDSLFVAYYASAELGCHIALGWPMPERILDLCAEFRCRTSGVSLTCGKGLLGAMVYFGLDALDAIEKKEMRKLAMRGGPYSAEEQLTLLNYCQSDVDSLTALLPQMLPRLDLPRALLRGRYMAAAARIEWNGIPIDLEGLQQLRSNWDHIKFRLVQAVDKDYGVFVPRGRRKINVHTTLGAEILREAGEYGIDPYQLADAVDVVWAEERQVNEESHRARRAARQRTGLNHRRIAQWENAGRDASSYPGLDSTARDLAGQYPALGIGRGYTSDEGEDVTDYASSLWDVLRGRNEESKPRYHPDILRRAAEIVAAHPVDPNAYNGRPVFSYARWSEWLIRNGIPWPQLESGRLNMRQKVFRQMAKVYPTVAPMGELLHSLSQLRLHEIAVGADARNRCLLSAFRARTGRNQPSNKKFIFGPSVWLRGLIQPGPGQAVAYVDWCQQEFGIAAALSGDRAMMDAYASGDPYLEFARQASAVPPEATKDSHKVERDRFKICALGVQYGMWIKALAQSTGQSVAHARELLRLHRETYPVFWAWSQAAVDHAMLFNWLATVFGWCIHVGPNVNPRSLANFPMQANGAEMLRLACCLATERGIRVCAPVHDAILVESSVEDIDAVVASTQDAMREASEAVLPGFPLRTEAKIVRWPDRYSDERGRTMWNTVWSLLDQEGCTPMGHVDGFERDMFCTPTGHAVPLLIIS
jgi:hypothetical protein